MADTRSLIVQKNTCRSAVEGRITSGTTFVENTARSGFTIQNAGTAVLFITFGAAGSATLYHYALSACTANDDGKGGSISQMDSVVYTGAITCSASGTNPIRFVFTEFS